MREEAKVEACVRDDCAFLVESDRQPETYKWGLDKHVRGCKQLGEACER